VIIVTNNGQNAKRIERTEFENELFVQEYIKNHPDTIPINEIKKGTKLLVFREFPTRVTGGIDVLAIDQDGEIYILETKLFRNNEKREVIGQVFHYAASLWHNYTESDFIETLENESTKHFKTAFKQKLKEYFALDDEGVTQLVEEIRKTLGQGSFRFLVLKDRLEDDLIDIITYINRSSRFRIYAVEMKYYDAGGMEIMIPTIHGTEVKSDVIGTGNGKPKWDESSFFKDSANYLNEKERAMLKDIYEFCKSLTPDISWGRGGKGSFSPILPNITDNAFFWINSKGEIQLYFERLSDAGEGKNYKSQFKDGLRRIAGFQAVDFSKGAPMTDKRWLNSVEDFKKLVLSMVNSSTQ
jgi:hypothetical protein